MLGRVTQAGPWLSVISELCSQSRLAGALQAGCASLSRHLPVTKAAVLLPAEDGLSLLPHAWHGNMASWQTDDFSQPITCCFRQLKSYCLDYGQRMYWQDNEDFVDLISQLEEGAFLFLLPLMRADGSAGGVLLIESCDKDLFDSPSLLQFSAILAGQIELLKRLKRQIASGQSLDRDLRSMTQKADEIAHSHQLEKQLVGDAPCMVELRKSISRASQSSLSVLIQGETGTGKDLIAQALHQLSDRSDKALITINCAAIPENLLESELFGYQAGAFSGAAKAKDGLIKAADGGSLFLDEIGDMPLALQAKLLRLLEAGKYRPLGASQEQSACFRLICATHVNLKQKVASGEFRRDLFYRISQFPMVSPALKNRKSDLAGLCQHLIRQFNQSHQRQVQGIRYNALSLLQDHEFPGNVRELKNVIEYACAHTDDLNEIEIAALPKLHAEVTQATTEPTGESLSQIDNLKQAMLDYEKQLISERLALYKGDRGLAADSLGLPKRTLAHKCQRLEISS